jgi:hypothetical protein
MIGLSVSRSSGGDHAYQVQLCIMSYIQFVLNVIITEVFSISAFFINRNELTNHLPLILIMEVHLIQVFSK